MRLNKEWQATTCTTIHRRTQDFTMEGVALVDTRVWFGCDKASAKREHDITGVWQSPQRGWVRGQSPLKLELS